MYATIFYSKATGRIATYAITEIPQDMNFFGSNRIDFEQIYDFIVLEYNDQIELLIRNRDLFEVDLDTKKIVQKPINFETIINKEDA